MSSEHYKNSKDLEFEFSYLDRLRNDGFQYQVPLPVPSSSGKLYTRIRGHFYWLYKFIDGQVIDKPSLQQLRQLATMMAQYHHMIEESNLQNPILTPDLFNKGPILREMNRFRSEIQCGRRRTLLRDSIFMEESSEVIKLLDSLDDSPYRSIKRYHIHRDIIPENLLWKDGKLTGLIDFENVSRSREPIANDIAVTLLFTCRDQRSKDRIDLERAGRFLQHYHRLHPLSKKEIQLIPDLLVSGCVEDFAFAYWMLRNDPERARLGSLKLYSAAARWSFANRKHIERALLN